MRNKFLDKFAIDFINNHFDEIDLKKLDWNISNKEQAIKEIKKKDYLAGWIITEVMRWGTSKDYQKDYLVENEDEHFIVKIGKRYFALDYDYIGIGDYTPDINVAKEKNMHRSMLNDSHIGKFRVIVDKVCTKSYKTYEKIDERFTTMTCSCCSHKEKHEPNVREFVCKVCGTTFYRDINSCLNFMNNLNLNLSGTDYDSLVKTKPTYTFKINQRIGSIKKMVDRERRIKEKL